MKTILVFLPFLAAALLAAAIVAVPLWWGRRHAGVCTRADHLAPYRQRLAELEQDLTAGVIDADAYREARTEAERQLLEAEEGAATANEAAMPVTGRGGTAVAVAVVVLVPALGLGIYTMNGRPGLLLAREAAERPADTREQLASLREKLPRLETRVAERPRDVEAWVMLARAYMALERPEAAVEATARAVDAVGDIPAVLVQRARALAVVEGRFTPAAVAALDRVLERAPAYPDALWFRGLAAARGGDWDNARRYWNRLRASLPPEARARLDDALAQMPGAAASGGETPPVELTVNVRLADGLAADVPPDTTVFVFARSPDGLAMPLAAARTTVGALPATLRLDTAMARASGRTLSPDQPLEIVARVSWSGQPGAAAGDYEGRVRLIPADSGGEPVPVTVDSRL